MLKTSPTGGSFSTPSTFIINSGCLSILTKSFVKKAQYAQITKLEALNACQSVLTDQIIGEEFKECLFDSLVENRVLVPSSKNIYLIQNVTTTQSILVNITRCYSPLCEPSLAENCYSPCCPNRKLVGLYLHDVHSDENDQMDWTSKIPRHILQELTPTEKKRQLAIEELENYENNFLKQLHVIRDIFARPLLASQTTIEEARRYSFHDTLFGNYHILTNHHKKLAQDLDAVRDVNNYNLFPDSTTIGNLLNKHFSRMVDPYIRYVSNHVFAKYQYTLEYSKNPAFVRFIEQQEAIEKDFRIPLKGLLISPIVRMAKYDLLLDTVLKNSEQDERDVLTNTISLLGDILHKINEATRNAEAEQRLMEIKFGLRVKRPTSRYQHRLQQILPDDVGLLFEGTVNLTKPAPIPPAVCQLFLFTNVLIITRKRTTAVGDVEFILVDKPIPIYMLRIGRASAARPRIGSHRQATLLSSIKKQYYQHLYRSHSDNSSNKYVSMTTASASASAAATESNGQSDEDSSIYSDVYTISGLKIRHRIKTMKQRIRKRKKTSLSTFQTTATATTTMTTTTTAADCLDMPSSLLQKAASYPSSAESPHILRSRLLQIHHIADPSLNYLFECPTTENRLLWKSKIRSVLPDPNHGPFGLTLLCSNLNCSQLQSAGGRYVTGCGTIWCSLPFTTSDGRNAIALGSQYGLWVAFRDGSELFKPILSSNCHQLELFDNKMIIARSSKPHRMLLVILIDDIYPPSDESHNTVSAAPAIYDDGFKNVHILQKSGVVHFAVGTLGGEPILCYLRRRRTGSIRLVLMFYRADGTTHSSWFKKFKEYKPLFIQPWDLKIIDDHVYIRSKAEGIEKVDILSWITTGSSSNLHDHAPKHSYRIDLPAPYHVGIGNYQVDHPALTTIGYVALNQPGTGLICSAQFACPVADTNADSLQQGIEFESEAKSVVVYYPYLIAFSSNVIEIRHLETTAFVQAIAGNKIKCLYTSRKDNSSAIIIHVSMLHADQDQTKVHQLYLKDPVSFDE